MQSGFDHPEGGLNLPLVNIMWHGPFTIEKLLLGDMANENGIYAIFERKWLWYGLLPLYIGRTERSFATRLREHQRSWLNTRMRKHRVRVGVVKDEDKHLLPAIEALIIIRERPPENIKNQMYYYGPSDLVINNLGNRGLLLPRLDAAADLNWSSQ